MTVSGLTITRAWRQPGHRQDRMTQKTLSAFRSDGRGLCRFRTATCCRRARISVWSAARSAKISMILCMPERVSGGDAKFQGFCHRWNKWEGQGAAQGAEARRVRPSCSKVSAVGVAGEGSRRLPLPGGCRARGGARPSGGDRTRVGDRGRRRSSARAGPGSVSSRRRLCTGVRRIVEFRQTSFTFRRPRRTIPAKARAGRTG